MNTRSRDQNTMTKGSETTRVVIPLLKALNAMPNTKAIKIHGSVYMEAGTPDVFASVQGLPPILFEAKWLGGRDATDDDATPIQQKRLREWREAQSLAWVVGNAAQALSLLSVYLRR